MYTHRTLLKYLVGASLLTTPVILTNTQTVYANDLGYTVIQATPETSFKMAIEGEYFPVNVQEILNYINQERKVATDNGYFGYKKEQYNPLKWNTQLEELARARAIEASLYPIHSRTSGENPSAKTFGENLAWYNTNTMDNIKLLMSEKNYYLKNRKTIFKDMMKVPASEMEKIGHYYAFLNPANKYVAAATFQMDIHSGITPNIMVDPDNPQADLTQKKNYGVTAVSFATNNHYGTNETPLKPIDGKEAIHDVLISSASMMELRGIEVWWPQEELTTGNAYQIKAKATTYYNDHGAIAVGNAPIVEGNWQSNNPNVLSVDRDGVVKALSDGEATITFSVKYAKNMTASKKFTVKGGKVTEVTTPPIAPTSEGVKYGEAIDRAVDLAPTQLVDRNESALRVMVKLRKKLDQLPELVAYKWNGLPLSDDFKMELQKWQSGSEASKKMEEVYRFAEYINASFANINKQDQLSSEEQAALKKEIVDIYANKVKNIADPDYNALNEEVRQVMKKAEVQNFQKADAAELEKQRPELLANLEENSILNAEEKAAFRQKIEQATSTSELLSINEEMQKAINQKISQDDWLQKQATAKQTLASLSHLTPQDRQQLEKEIDLAKDEATLQAILTRANELEEKNKNQEAEFDRAKQEAIAKIQAMIDLFATAKSQALEKIGQARTIDELHVVLDDTLQINEEHKKQRIEAMQNVQVLPYLSEQSKQGYLEQIKNAPSKEEMDSVVANASMEYYQNILKWNAARSEIENLNELTSAERNTFLNEISRTQDVDQLSEIVQRAKNLANERANTQQDLATAKQNAKDSLDKLTALTDVQKTQYQNQIDQATTKETVAEIVKQAQDENAKRLAEEEASQAELAQAKEVAKATITGLASLPEASKAEYAGQIDQATSKEAIAEIVKQAQDDNAARLAEEEASQAELAQAKAAAKVTVTGLASLPETSKAEYAGQIGQATSKETITAIVKQAQEENAARLAEEEASQAELAKAKAAAKATVAGLASLPEASKAEYAGQIDQATSKEAIAEIVKKAQDANATRLAEEETAQAELVKAKVAAKATVAGLASLPETSKAEYAGQIDQATTKEAIGAIVKQAQDDNAKRLAEEMAQAELAKAKEAAKATITGLASLPEASKAEYAGQIDQATSKEAIVEIVKQAQDDNAKRLAEEEAAQAELAKAKAAAKATITGLASLPEASKAEYAAQIDQATSKEAIAAIVKQAQDDNAKRLAEEAAQAELSKAKAAAKATITGLASLSTESKASYVAQLDQATSKEAVTAIVKQAQDANAARLAEEMAQAALAQAKAAAKATITGLASLPEASKATYTSQIDQATSKEAIAEIVKQAQDDNAKRLAEEEASQAELAQAKAAAKATITGLASLPEASKAEYAGQLDQATSKEAIAAIVKQAQDDNAQRLAEEEASQAELAKAKAAAKATITGLASLPEASKVEYAGQLDKATSKEAIAAIVKQAQDDNEDVKDYTADNTGASGDGQHQQGRLQTHTKNVGATISKSLQNLPQTNENQDSEEDTEKEKVSTNKKQKANDSQDNKISQSTTKEVMEEKKENKNTFVKIFSVLVAGLVSGWFFIMKKKSKK
ncbi:CAP domain-containing protein [Enterococcus cecorum]|uniref:CAP domain-containing protein n=2 Tax=Enterococcus cecorum TaxID=44008 RepID=UPI001FADAC32|nr:CAP domain-containing protein [Enterococcus cecorum]MCJ0557044.1 CAP domain-containing protein [Enterococcus cecorum]MCJ0562220.1 CAP domain-containing protein [Enterococcus cecorum]